MSFMNVLDATGTELHLKNDHPYWHQIQGQLHIAGLDVCDLVVWTPMDIQIIRIRKDPSWTANIERMINFYFNTFIPKVVS